MSERDAIVLGSGAEGLIAAAALARAGLKTLVLDEGAAPSLPLMALDPRVVKELALTRHGLQYAVRDMNSVALGSDGHHLALPRDLHAAGRLLSRHARGDKTRWPQFRRRLFRLARTLRAHWREEEPVPALAAELERLSALSAAAWLGAELESEALKALAAFDIASLGMSPHAPGSALALAWRAAQEVGGLQGAKVMPLGGAVRFLAVLEKAARQAGVAIDRDARVFRIRATPAGVEGVELQHGEFLPSPVVLSSFSRHHTLTKLLPRGVAGLEALARSVPAQFSTLQLGLTLAQPAVLRGEQHPMSAHFILAERLEQFAHAEAHLRAGEAPGEPLIGFTADGSRLSVTAWPARPDVEMGDAILAQLDTVISGAKTATIDHVSVSDCDPVTPSRLLAPARERVTTSVPGLYLCVEPMEALSGSAGLAAARLAAAYRKERSGA